MSLLKVITALSHEFGTADYVRGGGGNTSAKDADTLWVKPSGTTLAGLMPDMFVTMDREKLTELYAIETPKEPAAREALVKDMMAESVKAAMGIGAVTIAQGRPSVEAPLHETFDAAYVVHTHPTIVNGLTCSKNGPEECARLFPDALWMEYTDPGYTLCMRAREEIEAYADVHEGRQPEMVFMKNHGVFVAAQTPIEIRAAYARIMNAILAVYRKAGVSTKLVPGPFPPPEEGVAIARMLRETLGEEHAAHMRACGPFPIAESPISPDHIVYCKGSFLVGDPTPESLRAFRDTHGYGPRVIQTDHGVYGFGSTSNNAALALELAQDAALVKKLAEAFGGIEYLSDSARDFIDNWEVEAYRRKIASK